MPSVFGLLNAYSAISEFQNLVKLFYFFIIVLLGFITSIFDDFIAIYM